MKTTTWHVIPSRVIVHVSPNTYIFNAGEQLAHVEVDDKGGMYIHPIASGQLVIQRTPEV